MRAALLLLLLAACSRSDREVERLLAALQNGEPEGRNLADLGPDSSDGIPAILAVMERDETRFVQTTCLEALLSMQAGDEARDAVDRALRSRDGIVADRAALVAWKLYARRDNALDRLLRRAPADANARLLLARTPPIPDDVAAELIRKGSFAVLAALGPQMQPALPRIELALMSKAGHERIAAAAAHYRISGELEPAFTTLVRDFEIDNLFLRQRIHGVWAEMLREHPASMRVKLEKLRDHDNEAVRAMAIRMLGE